MNIAVLGTGMVGRALAGRLAGLGHDVVVGTRIVEQTLARTEPDLKGTPPYAEWQRAHPEVRLAPFPDAGAHAEIVVNATAGIRSLAVLEAVGAVNLAHKVLVDLAVPLDYSQGRPPRLAFANDDSLGEQIQRAFPDTRIVKTLNTMHVQVMIDPARVPGRHNVFLAGEDMSAKEAVKGLLGEFGWPEEAMIDLGGIRAARTTEMYAPLLFSLMGSMAPLTSTLPLSVVERTRRPMRPPAGEVTMGSGPGTGLVPSPYPAARLPCTLTKGQGTSWPAFAAKPSARQPRPLTRVSNPSPSSAGPCVRTMSRWKFFSELTSWKAQG